MKKGQAKKRLKLKDSQGFSFFQARKKCIIQCLLKFNKCRKPNNHPEEHLNPNTNPSELLTEHQVNKIIDFLEKSQTH